jgi:hypothetical protein
MPLPHRVGRVLFLSALLLPTLYLPAQAAGSRFVQTINTSTGAGSITIEGFSKPDFPGVTSRMLAPQSPVVVAVGAGSSPFASAILIRNAVNASGYVGFTASIPVECPDVVRIDFPGAFPMSIADTVPGQQYIEVPDPATVPTLSEWGMILLSLTILSLGAWQLYKGRRNIAGGLAS